MEHKLFRKFQLVVFFTLCTACFELKQRGNQSSIPIDQPNLEKNKQTNPLSIDARMKSKFVVDGDLDDSLNTYLYFLANGESLIASGRATSFIAQGEVVLPSRVGIKSILVRELKGNRKVESIVKINGKLIRYRLKL